MTDQSQTATPRRRATKKPAPVEVRTVAPTVRIPTPAVRDAAKKIAAERRGVRLVDLPDGSILIANDHHDGAPWVPGQENAGARTRRRG